MGFHIAMPFTVIMAVPLISNRVISSQVKCRLRRQRKSSNLSRIIKLN